MINIISTCPKCGGAGINLKSTSDEGGNVTTTEYDCTLCNGEGEVTSGRIEYADGLYRTDQILSVTVSSEYASLSDANKTSYGLIISCGVVDLGDDSVIKNKLWAMFGEATTTRANLIALIS